jgi:serine/threonine protein kinase
MCPFLAAPIPGARGMEPGPTLPVTPVLSPNATGSLHLGEGAADRDEHASNVLSLRRASVIGVVAWTLFGLTDWYVVSFVHPGRLWLYLALRAAGLAVLGLAALRMHAEPMPSAGTVRLLDVVVFATLSALVSAQCVELGGIASPLSLGIITILACRTAIVPDRWQRGLLPIGMTAIAHAGTLLLLALCLPSMRPQLGDGPALGLFGLNQIFVLGTAAISLVGAHKVWALRRKVYEARSLGRYRLIRRIGRGGMGEVWVAHHNTLRRDVAVKILRPDKMDALTRERFEREVHATSELSHPNTVRVYDYGVTEDGLCFYAMELLAGEDLGTVLRREGPLEPARVVRLLLQATRALAEAHGRGIVHRDLKPENLFITTAGPERDLVKVLDFGLARVTAYEDQETLTHTGFVVGTPAYIAPEVLVGQTADARADIYALGALMYKLLTGVAPFANPDQRAMLVARLRQDPPRPSAISPRALPADLEAVIMRCLSRTPGDRYQSAAELVEALVACDLGAGRARSSEPPAEPADEPVEAPTRVYQKGRQPPRKTPPAPVPAVRAFGPPAEPDSDQDTLVDPIRTL